MVSFRNKRVELGQLVMHREDLTAAGRCFITLFANSQITFIPQMDRFFLSYSLRLLYIMIEG